jgi:hypothetical protein
MVSKPVNGPLFAASAGWGAGPSIGGGRLKVRKTDWDQHPTEADRKQAATDRIEASNFAHPACLGVMRLSSEEALLDATIDLAFSKQHA